MENIYGEQQKISRILINAIKISIAKKVYVKNIG